MHHTEDLTATIDRLAAAAAALEQLTERLATSDESTISRIVAQVEDRRSAELEQKLAAAEQRIAELEAAASSRTDHGARKTIPTTAVNLLAKHGVALDSVEAGTLDAALSGLSLEQRFAVKAQLLRAGMLS